ncbi:hypothetical protein GGQ97_001070 [Sphingomonas kaistensis]|uniref:DUF2059 domain-containing protein n=1 Tax=Sphingomonas kaistensis TaxID=298708 RepID=A0A7X5Y540_9SPHN|nr:hypothetical protein [Sphingomonas kaistensis]NJC05277.1 hypothetical protein [Sphingomonas kaistensis]
MALRLTLALALAATVAPSAALAATPTKAVAPAKDDKPAPKADPAEAMAFVSKVFDKLFPAGPEPEPARLAAARDMSATMFPKGAYAEAMNGFTEKMADQMLNMSEADFADLAPPTPRTKKAALAAKPPSTEPLRLVMARKDPMFDAKVAAGKAFVKTMFVKVGEVAEPRFREGIARTMARRFDAQQLAEIQRFLATPTGAAYGRQMLGLWFDPEVMRGAYQSFPDMLKLMPGMMQEAATLEATMKAPKKAK